MYPKLKYNIKKLEHNINYLAKLVKKTDNFKLTIVTKSVAADKEIAKSIASNPNVDYVGDSRMENIISNKQSVEEYGKESMLLRLPMISEADRIVANADISLNSEIVTIKALNEEAKKQSKVHKVILMIDLGDLREGIFYEDKEKIMDVVKQILELSNIELLGVGTNLTCYGGIIPTYKNLQILCQVAKEIESQFNIKLPIVSGGNSSSVYLAERNELPEGINNLRLGESFLLCNDTAHCNEIKGCVKDAIICEVEIIELQHKPSLPIGEVGLDALGNKPNHQDKGVIDRAILAIGEQDTVCKRMYPVIKQGEDYIDDPSIEVLGSSSDHMILDVSKSKRKLKVGDTLEFRMDYAALLRLATSPYVEKEYL